MTLAAKRQTITNSSSLYINTLTSPAIELDQLPKFVKQFNALSYKNRIRLTLHVSDEFKSHFILLKGLIEFHRGAEFQFSYNRNNSTIETDFTREQVPGVLELLAYVQTHLEKELQFKKALKEILAFEAEYQRKKAIVYSAIF